MGSCVSIRKTSHGGSAMKLVSYKCKRDTVVTPASPTDPAVMSSSIKDQSTLPYGCRDSGSKDEIFFDSQPWLESDCEDDFFSVNGDFTPSCGNTPVHQSFSIGSPRPSKLVLDERPCGLTAEPSPTDKKTTLIDLFKDSIREDQEYENEAVTRTEPKRKTPYVHTKSAPTTPYVTVRNSTSASERTAAREMMTGKQRHGGSLQRCFPRLVSCGSFNDSRKRSSPAIAVSGK